MTPVEIGILGSVVMLLLLVCSMPVAVAMIVTGVVGYAAITSWPAALSMLSGDLYSTFANYNLTVIPLFVLMGQVAFHAGISGRLFSTANNWMSAMRGGLAMATVGACAAFSAVCGSGPATAATMAAVALPEMKKHKYDHALAAGTVASGGSLGLLIPPSVVFIVYGIQTEQSIGKLFIAGIVPGLLIAVLFCVMIYVKCLLNPSLAPPAVSVPRGVRFKSLLGVLETLLLFAFVMGGMFAGWFTPTEAAAMGALGSIIIAVMGGNCSFKMLWRAAQETVRTSCMVLVIVAGATIFGHFLAVTGMPTQFATWLTGLPFPPMATVSLIILFFFFVGLFVDSLALILLTVPIFYPVVRQLGFDPIWFGVIIVVMTQMGVITPPVGINVYVVSGIDRSIPLQTVFRGAVPFLLVLIVVCALMMVFPQIATWLPSMVR
jgi:tripartite ATP-independent transporter DctM subunit